MGPIPTLLACVKNKILKILGILDNPSYPLIIKLRFKWPPGKAKIQAWLVLKLGVVNLCLPLKIKDYIFDSGSQLEF